MLLYIWEDLKCCIYTLKLTEIVSSMPDILMTFLMYKGENAKLTQFLIDLNTKHDSIKFDYETSTKSIALLDNLAYIDENRHLQTTLYTKPTYTHNYLHSKSSHPRDLKDSLPYSQALRIKRICSQNNELNTHCEKLKK